MREGEEEREKGRENGSMSAGSRHPGTDKEPPRSFRGIPEDVDSSIHLHSPVPKQVDR